MYIVLVMTRCECLTVPLVFNGPLSLLGTRFNMLAKTRQTWKLDGMNTAEYDVLTRDYLPLYTNISVNIGTEAGLHATQLSNTPAKTPAIPPVKLSDKVPAKPPVKPKQDQPKSQHH